MQNRYSEVHRCKDANQKRIFPPALGLVPVTTTTPHRAGRLDVGGPDPISDFMYPELGLAGRTPRSFFCGHHSARCRPKLFRVSDG
jgi:hypothetical protein